MMRRAREGSVQNENSYVLVCETLRGTHMYLRGTLLANLLAQRGTGTLRYKQAKNLPPFTMSGVALARTRQAQGINGPVRCTLQSQPRNPKIIASTPASSPSTNPN